MWEIVVTERVTRRTVTERKWTQVGVKSERDEVAGSVMERPVYDWTPQVDQVVAERVTRYEQRVEDLDLRAVIAAINGLKAG
jgi:hypothetical protein